jgi:Asp/Glu/hydantoin racemase
LSKKKIAILHTSFVFVSVEPIINDLIAEKIPEAKVIHFVDSDVLATVQREGRISSESTARMVHLAQAAELAGADIIFSACSSLGPALDAAEKAVSIPVVKIDEAMAKLAATQGKKIAVMATVPSTLGPTSDLIQKWAQTLGRTIDITQVLSEGAFDALMSGDRPKHDAMVTEKAIEVARTVDLIVLSQASMNRLGPELSKQTNMKVLSSPNTGIDYLAEKFNLLGKVGCVL